MQRKYESIHLSLPFVCLYFLPFLFFSRVCLSCLLVRPLLFYLCSAFISGLLEMHFRGEVMSLHSVQLSCLPRFVLTSHSRYLFLFFFPCLHLSPSISSGHSVLYIPSNHTYTTSNLSGSLRCMRGTVFTVCSSFPWSKWARIGFPERFIAAVVWCFPHTATGLRSL